MTIIVYFEVGVPSRYNIVIPYHQGTTVRASSTKIIIIIIIMATTAARWWRATLNFNK